MNVAVIADIVGSRQLADRATAQGRLDAALAAVAQTAPDAPAPLRPVVGDELEGRYSSLGEALATTMLLRLALPDGIDCRFGIGIGDVSSVPAATAELSDGPGWWAAREAIEHVAGLARRRVPGARTWVGAARSDDAPVAALANAGAVLRDELIGAMSARTRRLTYGRCRGRTQRDLADEEGITQSAVSQLLATAGGAALVEAYRQLHG